jgi:hypothetical protein
MKALLYLSSFIALLVFGGCKSMAIGETSKEYLVGAYYFAGWWREKPNKWTTGGQEWLPSYPEREPLLGLYNEQETMDKEILVAAQHGVDFFFILYYPMYGIDPGSNEQKLNEGLRTFLASPNNHLLKFAIEYVNHPPFHLPTDELWEEACRKWAEVMKHPSYLRVAGRPVFKVHSIYFLMQESGNDIAKMKARVDTLRRIVKEVGIPDPIIAGGMGPDEMVSVDVAAPFDFLATYMGFANMPATDKPYPYEDLIKFAEKSWIAHASRDPKPYMPYVPSGWDPRPWKDPRPPYTMPTREEWKFALRRVQAALDKYANLGIPIGNGSRQKAFVIYAWNEFGEGGFIAPTKGEGTMKLEVIKEVFGVQSR